MNVVGYPLGVMHHYELPVDGSAAFLRRVARGDIERSRASSASPRAAARCFRYGAVGADRRSSQAMKPGKIVVSALGVREGFLYSLLSPEEQTEDPLISAAEELALLRARSVTHAHELARWTGESFAAFNLEESEDETRYREAACLLADIGWRAHPEYRGIQSLNIIAHASFIGVDHPGRAFIALTNMFRHEGVFDDSVAPEIRALATPRYLERARLLGALLRVVYLLSASMPGVIPKLRWRAEADGGLSLIIPRSHAGLDGERPAGRMAQLSRITGRNLALRVAAE